ncbi:MAG: hypothetical protein ACPGQL_01620 [Thermoplasmatota archaeon]
MKPTAVTMILIAAPLLAALPFGGAGAADLHTQPLVTTSFYIHSDDIVSSTLVFEDIPDVLVERDLHILDTRLPTASADLPTYPKGILLAGSMVETLFLGEISIGYDKPTLALPTANVASRLTTIEGDLYISTLPNPNSLVLPDQVRGDVYIEDTSGQRGDRLTTLVLHPGAATISNPALVNPGPVARYQGSTPFPQDVVLDHGERIVVDLQTTNGAGLINVDSRTFPSGLSLTGRTLPVQPSIEDAGGASRTSYPGPGTPADQRSITLSLVADHAFGNSDCNGPAAPANDCADDAIDQNAVSLRVHDAGGDPIRMSHASGAWLAGPLADTRATCCDELTYANAAGTASWTYDLHYGTTTPTGDYTAQWLLQDGDNTIELATQTFTIGAGGPPSAVDFTLGAPGGTSQQLAAGTPPQCGADPIMTLVCFEGEFFGFGFFDYADYYTEDQTDVHSSTFQLELENEGSSSETYELVGFWVPDSGLDRPRCAGEPAGYRDGLPDGWGFTYPGSSSVPWQPSYGDGAVQSSDPLAAYAGTFALDTITLAAGATASLDISLGFADDAYVTDTGYTNGDDVCTGTGHGGNQDASPEGTFRVVAISESEPDRYHAIDLHLERV